MPETVYFEDASARISNAWFVFGHRVYSTHGIFAVTTRTISSSHGFWRSYFSLLGMPFVIFWWYLHAENPFYVFLGYVLAPLIIVAFGYLLYAGLTRPRNYIILIRLEGAFGRSTAFATLDKSYADTLIVAISNALSNKAPIENSPAPSGNQRHFAQNVLKIAQATQLSSRIVDVTSTEVGLGNSVYDLCAIKSARVWPLPFESVDDLLSLLGSIGYLLWMIFGFPIWVPIGSSDPIQYVSLPIAAAGIITFGVMNIVRSMRKPVQAHLVELRGTFGCVNAFVSLDGELVKALVSEINEARKRYVRNQSAASNSDH